MAAPPSVRLRLRLMRQIAATIEQRGLKQREAAALFGTTQPRISEIVRGRVDEFTLDSLVNMLSAAGVQPHLEAADAVATPPPDLDDPVISAYMRDVDRTLVREALRRTSTERVQALAALQRLAAEASRGGRAHARPRGRRGP